METNVSNEFFAKTDISEMASQPTPITFALLEQIYSEGGPVQSVYKKYGVKYRDTHFLKVIGNELVVDKQKELHSLLPSYRYPSSLSSVPKLSSVSELFTTLKNIFALQTLPVKNFEQIFVGLKKELQKNESASTLSDFLENFLQEYQVIFETNLLCGVAFKKLEFTLKKESIQTPEILKNASLFVPSMTHFAIDFSSQNFQGNSIEISDETKFIHLNFNPHTVDDSLKQWWEKLPDWKRKYFQPIFSQAIIYNRLREYSRVLIVKKINELRTILVKIADTNEFSDRKNIYFCTLEEILKGNVTEAMALPRKKLYFDPIEKFTSGKIQSAPRKFAGVSSGKASGILVDEKSILQYNADQNIILYSEILTPQLTEYFHKIKGIVSTQGGVLSHIAIVAREHGIPVVVNFCPNDEIQIGDTIFIDGDTSEIKKHS